ALATGHYCQTQNGQLHKGLDPNKDQSYFLYTIKSSTLNRVHFPIGHLEKPHVRAIAEKASLPVFSKKDSTGICFIGKRNFRTFLEKYIP
ncbi:tRNA 2-thiouridine(34) synthase MnmA, partial [bacterium LRH843]|nr:tRNA 2-thiouridine(34) synthase MnmA [bacterium LRH843]